jgi:hypothetical protein
MTSPSSDVRVCFVCTHLRVRCLRFLPGLPLPAHIVGQPTTTSPSSTTLSHPPPFALADSPPPLASTAIPNPPKQALHPLHTSLIQPLRCLELCTANSPPLCARHRATTRRDFGAASSLMSQNDRVVALLLPLVVNSG